MRRDRRLDAVVRGNVRAVTGAAVIAFVVCAGLPARGAAQEPPLELPAEDASLNGVEVAQWLQGYSGEGYVTAFDEPGDYMHFSVTVPREDSYTLSLRYLNGGGAVTHRLLLDGVRIPGGATFYNVYDAAAVGRTGDWQTMSQTVRLPAGNHSVTLAFVEGQRGDLKIDGLHVLDRTASSSVSARSLIMNNWTDLVGIHHSAKLDAADGTAFGPLLAALHWKGDWPTSQIDGATAYVRDSGTRRTLSPQSGFDSDLYFDAEGILHADYRGRGDQALPIGIRKQYAMVPEEPILLARYTLSNQTGERRSASLMELVDVNVLSADASAGSEGTGDASGATGSGAPTPPPSTSGQRASARWYPEHNAWIADMTRTNGVFLVFGAFSLPQQSHAATQPGSGPVGQGSDILARFEGQRNLQNNSELTADDLLMAIRGEADLDAAESAELTFFYSVQPSFEGAVGIARRIQERGAQAWFDATRTAWKEWLATGRSTVDSGDPGVDAAYTRNLVVLRHAQQPEFGSFPASTNPSYDYKVWPRDATISALSLVAAGYYAQAEKFWSWMATVQEEGTGNVAGQQGVDDFPNGTWYTNYGYWSLDEPIPFVQPEWDSVGQFLIGVYHHFRGLNRTDPAAARAFLEKLYPAVVDSAAWIARNVEPGASGQYGFGPPGYSVWEEDFEYATYTQVTYASGLNAARLLAREMGEMERADTWLQAATTIRDNLLRPVSAEGCGGMWDDQQGYFIRGVFPPSSSQSGSCEPHAIVDGSTDLLWVFGLLDVSDPRAQAHRQRVLDVLSPPYEVPPEAECAPPDVVASKDFGLGISRYEGDTFYYTSEFSPGGRCESSVPMPSWPWMSSYMSMAESWLGMDDRAFARLQWYVSVTGTGFMPTGESVDWNTQQPLPSTMSQPDDGGYNLQIALLAYLGAFDPRLPALE